MHATTSVGIAIGPADGEIGQLLRAADMALYRAKAEGRNAFRFYAAEMSAQVEARKALGRSPGALERGDLTLEFQPQFEFARAASSVLKRWCVGGTPGSGRCPRLNSSRWRKAPG
jgi:predicted signal transduction protein with EAL and GGDEF domain